MNHEKLISEIKDSCRAHSLPTEYLEQLVGEYNRACEKVNERLGEINRLVKSGHKNAAVQLAEESPNVLEQMAELDFPEKAQWCDVLKSNGVNPPKDLAIGHAEILESTYSELRLLEPLLIKHRLLALSQAPLKSRIRILKKLAEQDPTNVYWQEDLESYEQARLNQLDGEYLKAKAKGDYDRLRRLKKEVVENSWSVPVPKQLKRAITNTADKIGRNDALSKISVLSEKLNAAYAEHDDASAKKTRVQWDELNSVLMLETDHPEYQQVEDVFAWLDELENERVTDDAFQASLGELEKAVDNSLPVEELDRSYYDAQKFDREIPEALDNRVDQYRKRTESSARRKAFWRNAIIAATGLLVASIVGWFVVGRANASKLSGARGTLQQFLNDEDFPAGVKFGDSLPEWIATDAEVISLRQKLIDAEDAALQRRSEFKKWEDGFEINGELGSRFDDQIAEGRKLANSDEEIEIVDSMQRLLDTEREARLGERNKRFQLLLKKHENELWELKKTGLNELPEQERLRELVGVFRDAASDARQEIDGKYFVSLSNRKTADRLHEESQRLADDINWSIDASTQTDVIRAALQKGDLAAYSKALDRFYSDFGSRNENSTDFKSTASEVKHWQSLLELSWVIGRAKRDKLRSLTPAAALELRKNLAGFFAYVECEQDCLPLLSELEAINSAQENSAVQVRLKETMDLNKFSKIEVLELTPDGKPTFYYLKKPIKLSPRDRFCEHYRDDETTSSTNKKLPAGKLKTGNAPHAIVANRILSLLEKSQGESPENMALAAVEFALGEPQENELSIDHAAHARIVWITIQEYARKLAPRFGGFWDNATKRLQNSDLHQIDFKDFDADDYSQLRDDCKSQLEIIRQDFAVFQEVLKKQNEFDSCKQYLNLKICGWIFKENGKWKFDRVVDELDDTSLFCLQVTGGKSKMYEIGRHEQGKFVPESEELFQAGRPVFARFSNDR